MCFEYRIGEYGDDWDFPNKVGCPTGPPLVTQTLAPSPSLPNDMVERVTVALKSLEGRYRPVSVQSVVELVAIEAGARLEVITMDGWTGIAVRAGSDCLLGRVKGKTVDVRPPSEVALELGELTCVATTAVRWRP